MRKGAVEEAGLAKLVAMLLAGKEDDVASLVLLTEVVGDLARVGTRRHANVHEADCAVQER